MPHIPLHNSLYFVDQYTQKRPAPGDLPDYGENYTVQRGHGCTHMHLWTVKMRWPRWRQLIRNDEDRLVRPDRARGSGAVYRVNGREAYRALVELGRRHGHKSTGIG